jgi:predicted DNA-binding helix-hairpin-helix protein
MLDAGNSAQVPLVRENRLYQADWLMRFIFKANEILEKTIRFLI